MLYVLTSATTPPPHLSLPKFVGGHPAGAAAAQGSKRGGDKVCGRRRCLLQVLQGEHGTWGSEGVGGGGAGGTRNLLVSGEGMSTRSQPDCQLASQLQPDLNLAHQAAQPWPR